MTPLLVHSRLASQQFRTYTIEWHVCYSVLLFDRVSTRGSPLTLVPPEDPLTNNGVRYSK
jgi:hypothetical protein